MLNITLTAFVYSLSQSVLPPFAGLVDLNVCLPLEKICRLKTSSFTCYVKFRIVILLTILLFENQEGGK